MSLPLTGKIAHFYSRVIFVHSAPRKRADFQPRFLNQLMMSRFSKIDFPASLPEEPVVESSDLYPVRPTQGVCEVVLYSPNHTSSPAQEPVEKIYKLVLVWTDRFRELGFKAAELRSRVVPVVWHSGPAREHE